MKYSLDDMRGIKAVLGANIKHYRKKMRLSQEQLAEKLEISTKHLSTIETGVTFVSAELLEKITRQLLVSASALFYSVDEISTNDNMLGKIDSIVDKECEKASAMIKMQIRYLSSQ
ncbi:MAG: helix-turn-helix domain-containing protein [Treponema sp.]|jgi:transcriptional regulator with XRE-family HTH domain|nr:helix-turn-helix domain-containing protein [Treponema sp.]